jgi:hypothetical protein
MDEKEISLQSAALLLDQLMKRTIPVVGVFVSESGAVAKLYGFVSSIRADPGLVISSSADTPSMSSTISVPIGNPAGAGCTFSLGSAPDEPMELKYGDTVFVVRRHGMKTEKLMLFFTAKPFPQFPQ